MNKSIPLVSDDEGVFYQIDLKPTVCPYCRKSQILDLQAFSKVSRSSEFVFCICTNPSCRMAFVLPFNLIFGGLQNFIYPSYETKSFNEKIELISPQFCKIYNEAYTAEQIGLEQITGVGYRKSLEFLIKDYLISIYPSKEEEIKANFLSNCINELVEDKRIKSVASRAAWLGNDQTHYIQKWEDKDVTHLKGLINLCLHWIEAEIETKIIEAEMPTGR